MSKNEKGVLPAIKTQLTAPHFPKQHEVVEGKSMTTPGQAMSVLDMIKRHRAGLPVDQNVGAIYTGADHDNPFRNLEDMDLVERQQYIDSVADQLVEVKARIEASAKTKAEKEFLAKVDEEVKKHLANMRSKDDKNQVTDLEESK